MKARLWKGPFSGKVIKADGRNEIVFTGPKRMSREEQYRHQRDFYASAQHGFTQYKPPMVRAQYRICVDPISRQPFRHPDGSYFYEFVDKKEY